MNTSNPAWHDYHNHQLQEAFHFTPEDFRMNQEGRLSDEQISYIKGVVDDRLAYNGFIAFFPFIFIIGFAVLTTGFDLISGRSPNLGWLFSGSLMTWLVIGWVVAHALFVVALVQSAQLRRKLGQGAVEIKVAVGPVEVKEGFILSWLENAQKVIDIILIPLRGLQGSSASLYRRFGRWRLPDRSIVAFDLTSESDKWDKPKFNTAYRVHYIGHPNIIVSVQLDADDPTNRQ